MTCYSCVRHILGFVQSWEVSTKNPRNGRGNFIDVSRVFLQISRDELPVEKGIYGRCPLLASL